MTHQIQNCSEMYQNGDQIAQNGGETAKYARENALNARNFGHFQTWPKRPKLWHFPGILGIISRAGRKAWAF